MPSIPAGEWLRKSRQQLGLAQSDVAAFLSMMWRKSVSQARISEIENGVAPISSDTVSLLASFFRQVARQKRNGRGWQDIFPH
ncbi:MAG: Helix-turn-helix domain [Chthonomonadales bacterium]|nr:Helix-turn-helix domain [Chthonomonadales bacterium]